MLLFTQCATGGRTDTFIDLVAYDLKLRPTWPSLSYLVSVCRWFSCKSKSVLGFLFLDGAASVAAEDEEDAWMVGMVDVDDDIVEMDARVVVVDGVGVKIDGRVVKADGRSPASRSSKDGWAVC